MRGLLQEWRKLAGLSVTFPTDSTTWIQIVKAACATSVAWALALWLTSAPVPVFAPLAAMLTVQATVVDSIRTGVQRTIGVVVGVLLAFALSSALGVHWWSVGLMVFVGLAVGKSLALERSGANQIATSALLVLVLSSGRGGGYAWSRILETLIGAAVGIVVSLVFVRRVRVHDSGVALRRFADLQASVLTSVAEALRSSWPGENTRLQLEQARALDDEQAKTRTAVEKGDASVRYNVRSQHVVEAIGSHQKMLRRLERTKTMVRGIIRTLADESDALLRDENPAPPLDESLRNQLITVLLDTASTLRQAGRVAVDETGTVSSANVLEALHAVAGSTAEDARALVSAARRAELPSRQWLVLGAVLTDLRRMVAELNQS